jgi:Zn-dependent peptidase ImmA (M78 family)
MTDLEAPPEQRPPASSADESSADVPLWTILAAVGFLLVLLAVGGFVLVKSQQQSGPSYPDHWDPRIAPYAKIAEQKRGLFFEHPVAVRFLRPKAFEKTVKTDEDKLDADDRKELKQATGLMRAFGLVKGDVDLLHASNEASGAGTLAYYSYEDKTITIRGRKLTPAVRFTLVHELTHVLQDQHFDIGARSKALAKASDTGKDDNEESVFDALVEGDAERVAALYRKSLSPKQRKAIDAGQDDEASQATKRTTKVPKVLITMIESPYALGEQMVETVAADGGNAAVDQLFRDTPTHETALLDPFTVLAGRTGAIDVDAPRLAKSEKKFDSGELGVLTWYFMLAERMPLRDALTAADGWGGDAYVAYDRGDRSCARMSYAGRTPQDTTRMLVALRRWVAAAPGSPALVTRAGRVLHFRSCDPGTKADIGNDASEDALQLVAIRSNIGLSFLRAHAPEKAARCIAAKFTRQFTMSQLTDPNPYKGHPGLLAKGRRIVAGCR